jgi:AraC-like DNA-binding protein
MPRHTSRTLLDRDGLKVVRVTCDGHDGPRLTEEVVAGDRLVVVLWGRFGYRDRVARVIASPARAVFLSPERPHHIHHPSHGGDLCVAVGGRLVSGLAHAGPPTRLVSSDGYVRLRAALDAVAEGGDDGTVALEEALTGAVDPGGAPPPPVAARRIADTVAEGLELGFDRSVTVAALADRAGVSPFHACRAFRLARGVTIHQAQVDLRLRHALALLLDTGLPLAQVALEAGFANQGHLGNTFKQRFGVSPGLVRREGPRALAVRAP